MVRGEGMAPFHDIKRSNAQRWKGDILQTTERASISPRQDENNDKDGGFGRGGGRGSRFGNKGDGDGSSGGGGDGNRNGNGRGRFGGFRGGSDNNDRNGGRFGGGGRGGGNGGNNNNDSNDSDNNKSRFGGDGGGGRGFGNGNGRGNNNNGNNRNNGNGNGNGNGRNNGNNSNDGNGGGGGGGGSRDGGGSKGGNGDGTGTGTGTGNGNDSNNDANLPPPDSPAETPTDAPPPAASAAEPDSPDSPVPVDQETPEASVEPPGPAPGPSSTSAPDAAVPSDLPDPGTVAPVSDAPPEAPVETNTVPTPAIPQLASDAIAPPPDVTRPPPAAEPSFSADPLSSLPLPPPSLPQSTTVAAPESLPTSFVEPNNPGDGSIDRGSEDGLGSDVPSDAARAGLDPTVERILISVGSIGAFILICSVGYLIWRAMRKSGKKRSGSKARRSRGASLSRLLPGSSSRKQRAWESPDDPRPAKGSPPSYREKASSADLPHAQDFYAPEKLRPEMPQEVPPLPQTKAPKSVDLFVAAQPQNMPDTKAQVQGLRASSLNGLSAASTMVGTHQAQDSFSSTAPMHFDDGSDTARSRMGPGVFFNQSEMARQPSTAYDPARRQVNRTSVMSSLSSGFGDGEFMVPVQTVSPPPQAALAVSGIETTNYSRRFSWASQSTGQAGRRDTTFTQSSEDMPPRFRSLNSWIDQQTGRIKRAQQREAEQGPQPPIPHHAGQPGVPGVHNPPREPSFNLMMDDEVPRRIESVIPTSSQ